MRSNKYILPLLAALAVLFSGCGVKRSVIPAPQEAAWHTCLIQGARATVNADGQSYSAAVIMQTVRDSMLVISVTPMLGIEMMRIEATPFEITGINKMDGTYASATFADLNRKLSPTLNWDVLQQVCSAELPTGAEHARLIYSLGDKTMEILIDYPIRKLDVPVKVFNIPTTKYTKIDITRWL